MPHDIAQDLNPQQLSDFAIVAWSWGEAFMPRLVAAAAIMVVGYVVAGWTQRALQGVLAGVHRLDPTLKPLFAAVARYAVMIVVVIAALSQLGIETASLLAVLGAAGLAIGLALQGTLSNIAAGIMLLWLRPFRAGDYIEVGGQGGTVEEVGLFGCQLRTFDGLFLFLPNSTIWNAALKNHTRNAGRLVSLNLTIPGAAEIEHVRAVLLALAAKVPDVLPAPEPQLFVESFAGGTFVLNLMMWTTPDGAGAVERTVIKAAKEALDALGDNFKPTQITRAVPADADPSRFFYRRIARGA